MFILFKNIICFSSFLFYSTFPHFFLISFFSGNYCFLKMFFISFFVFWFLFFFLLIPFFLSINFLFSEWCVYQREYSVLQFLLIDIGWCILNPCYRSFCHFRCSTLYDDNVFVICIVHLHFSMGFRKGTIRKFFILPTPSGHEQVLIFEYHHRYHAIPIFLTIISFKRVRFSVLSTYGFWNLLFSKFYL